MHQVEHVYAWALGACLLSSLRAVGYGDFLEMTDLCLLLKQCSRSNTGQRIPDGPSMKFMPLLFLRHSSKYNASPQGNTAFWQLKCGIAKTVVVICAIRHDSDAYDGIGYREHIYGMPHDEPADRGEDRYKGYRAKPPSHTALLSISPALNLLHYPLLRSTSHS
ncbi:hypothetical protein EDD16DRAFT_1610082 [Pisolithus croceorrhizus]|nr:hypothetical protein EDD16DRAFT_1610082 [Pisolithus croceorrhizus]